MKAGAFEKADECEVAPTGATPPIRPQLVTVATLACGMLFGFGLAWSTMIRPESVLAFLSLRDFGLLLVLGVAVGINLVVYQLLPRFRRTALLGGPFQDRGFVLEKRAVFGGVIFGLGWGICGVCPGPALAGVGAGDFKLLVALGGIFAGALLHGLWAGGQAGVSGVSGRSGT